MSIDLLGFEITDGNYYGFGINRGYGFWFLNIKELDEFSRSLLGFYIDKNYLDIHLFWFNFNFEFNEL